MYSQLGVKCLYIYQNESAISFKARVFYHLLLLKVMQLLLQHALISLNIVTWLWLNCVLGDLALAELYTGPVTWL